MGRNSDRKADAEASPQPILPRAQPASPTWGDPCESTGAIDGLGRTEDETSDQLSLISLPTAASIAGVLALIAAWLSLIVVVGGLWLLKTPPPLGAHGATQGGPAATVWTLTRAPVVALALAACLTFASVVLAMLVTWVRPLRSLVRATTRLIQGQWHRPIPQSIAAIAPVQQLAVIYEDLRGSLVERLRSSTELNLQLESEVARRTAELERRNSELAALLQRLESTRSEILRNEKLATVGRIGSDVACSIDEPMAVLTSLPPRVAQGFAQLSAMAQTAPAGGIPSAMDALGRCGSSIEKRDDGSPRSDVATLSEIDAWLAAVIESAASVSHVVRALRVYARPESLPASLAPRSPWPAGSGTAPGTNDDEKADPSPTRLPPA